MNPLESYTLPEHARRSESVRVARILEIAVSDRFGEIDLARQVSEGLSTNSVRALVDLFGRREIVGPVVPEATFRRFEKAGKPLPRQYSERIYLLGRIVDVVGRVYQGDIDRVRAFMTRSHPLLDGETPLDLARSGSAGADVVLNLVLRAEAGIAV
ncbi:MAG: antitoxin Xre/MbcA/ParS toxin-binding domain-containing protein [Pseudomonadota bacterium]